MRAFGKLPSSPDIMDMNQAQWIWSYLNIVKDSEEEEELWKARFKYNGLFINPDGVRAVAKAEEREKRKQKGEIVYDDDDDDLSEEPVYVSSAFEEEMQKVFSDSGIKPEEFIELPEPNGQYGDPDMSSDEFVNFVSGNLNKFDDLQQEIEFNKLAQNQLEQYDDLDVFEFDE